MLNKLNVSEAIFMVALLTVCCRYVSNTKIKFMLVLSEPIPKDDELRHVRASPKSLSMLHAVAKSLTILYRSEACSAAADF